MSTISTNHFQLRSIILLLPVVTNCYAPYCHPSWRTVAEAQHRRSLRTRLSSLPLHCAPCSSVATRPGYYCQQPSPEEQFLVIELATGNRGGESSSSSPSSSWPPCLPPWSCPVVQDRQYVRHSAAPTRNKSAVRGERSAPLTVAVAVAVAVPMSSRGGTAVPMAGIVTTTVATVVTATVPYHNRQTDGM
jgi:hypothetical protein